MALDSSSHTLYAQLVSKAATHEHEAELYELTQLAEITIDPEVFKIVLDLLEMKCSPKSIADVLRSMLKHSPLNTGNQHETSGGDSFKLSSSSSHLATPSSQTRINDSNHINLSDTFRNATSRSSMGDLASDQPSLGGSRAATSASTSALHSNQYIGSASKKVLAKRPR